MLTALTDKEKLIFELNAQGMYRKDICAKLNIKRATLQTYFNDMAVKLGMPEQMNIQYFLACLKIKKLKKRQKELESLLNECTK